LHGLTSDSDGVVADPLELHIEPQDRGDESQVARAGQVSRYESVALLVDGTNLTVDRLVTENDLVGQLAIARQRRMDRVLEPQLDLLRHFLDPLADQGEIVF